MSEDYEIDEIVRKEVERMKKKQEEQGSEVNLDEIATEAEKTTEGEELPATMEMLAEVASRKFNVSKESILNVMKELMREEDPELKKILNLTRIQNLIKRSGVGGRATQIMGDLAMGKAIQKTAERIIREDDKDFIDRLQIKLAKAQEQLLTSMLTARMIGIMVNQMSEALGGTGNQESKEVESKAVKELRDEIDALKNTLMQMMDKLEEKKAEKSFSEQLRDIVGSQISPMVNRLEELDKRLQKIEEERKKKELEEFLRPLVERTQKLEELIKAQQQVQTMAVGAQTLTPTPQSITSLVEEFQRTYKELQEAYNKLSETIKAKGSEMPPEVKAKVEYLEKELEELRRKSTVGDVLGEVVKNPNKIREMLNVAKDMIGMIKETMDMFAVRQVPKSFEGMAGGEKEAPKEDEYLKKKLVQKLMEKGEEKTEEKVEEKEEISEEEE